VIIQIIILVFILLGSKFTPESLRKAIPTHSILLDDEPEEIPEKKENKVYLFKSFNTDKEIRH
jgi:hypothetical protein